MTVITDYSQAVRDARSALRYYKQTKTYTKSHLEAWSLTAHTLYPDTTDCSFADLRNCYVHGCIMGYEFALVFTAPMCYDRLQSDAFIAGVVDGENCWMEEQQD